MRWYLRYGLSYRDIEELLVERGVEVDHVTVYRWVQRFTPLLADAARPCLWVPKTYPWRGPAASRQWWGSAMMIASHDFATPPTRSTVAVASAAAPDLEDGGGEPDLGVSTRLR